MAFVNIPRDRDDPNYRYKMPRMQSRIEGRGNGIKTNIYNMGEIARALKRPPMYPTKFFGCELGAMAKFEDAEEKALVNGAHAEKDLVSILDKFIEMYVLCPECHLPEIDIMVKKNSLMSKCNACGYQGELDIRHKVATYMIRNPPNQASSTLGKKKKSKEERRQDKANRQMEGMPGAHESEEEEEDHTKKDKKKKEKEKEKKVKKEKVKKKVSVVPEEDLLQSEDNSKAISSAHKDSIPVLEGNPDTDTTVEKKKKKKKKKSENNDKLMQNEELTYESPEIGDVVERIKVFIASNESTTADDFFRELRVVQVSQDFSAKCRVYVALMALFNDHLTPEDLLAKMDFVKKVCDSSINRSDFLEALQYYCHEKSPATLSSYPYIVQKLYAAELLDSEDILKFYEGTKADPMFEDCKKVVQPFLDWLAENESESENDEEDTIDSSEYLTPQSGPAFKTINSASAAAVSSTNILQLAVSPPESDDEFHDIESSFSEDEIDVDGI